MGLCSREAGWSALVAGEVEGTGHGRICCWTSHCGIAGISTLVDGVDDWSFYDSGFAPVVGDVWWRSTRQLTRQLGSSRWRGITYGIGDT